jgi:hypothetical protein
MTVIVDTPNGMEYFKKRKATTVQRYLAKQWEERKDEICELMNADMPYSEVYPELYIIE